VVVVKNGGCNTSHSKRVEQAFYTKYQGFQSFLIIGGTSQILEGT
jgi:hypothetical protein